MSSFNPEAGALWRFALLVSLFIAALLLGILGLLLWMGTPISDLWPSPSVEQTSPAWERAKPRLAEAERLSAEALDKRVAQLRGFFGRRRTSDQQFADEVLSLEGKWVMLSSTVLMDRSHADFLADAFRRHVFTPEDLQLALDSAVAGFLADLDALENGLVVGLQADLSDEQMARGLSHRPESDAAFREALRHAAARVGPELGIDLAVTGGSVLAMTIGPAPLAADLVAGILVRTVGAVAAEMGISCTFMGAGAVAGVATLGLSVVAMVALDAIVSRLLDLCGYSAERNVKSAVFNAVVQTRDRIISGKEGAVRGYEDLRKAQGIEPMPWVRNAIRAAADRIEKGGNLGLAWELGNVRRKRALLLRESLRRVLVGEGKR